MIILGCLVRPLPYADIKIGCSHTLMFVPTMIAPLLHADIPSADNLSQEPRGKSNRTVVSYKVLRCCGSMRK